MKTVSIITLGCKVNQVESEQIAEKLESYGFDVSMGLSVSDIYVINTCAVTNEAERKSRNYIAKILKLNPSAKIYVCGCSSENDPNKFKKGDYVVKVIGNKDKLSLAETIKNDNLESKNLLSSEYKSRVTNRTRADLFVQNGCNNFCTYCIIPYLRGRETSFPLNEIKAELKILETLANEIVVTGINLSAYGKDIEGSDGLIEIARLFKDSSARFRFSSLEVNVITEKFLSELAEYNNFCDQFHLSLQSGSNNTLKAMNRHYTKEQYLEKVNLIRKFFPNAGITTDIIVGFPTETEDDAAETLDFIKQVKFQTCIFFHTQNEMEQLQKSLKMWQKMWHKGLKDVSEVARQMKADFISKNIGLTHEVIIENQKEGYYLCAHKKTLFCVT